MGQLLPSEDQKAQYAQVYIHDAEEQLRLRASGPNPLKVSTLEFRNKVMVDNPFARRFRQIGLENCPEKKYVIKERIGDDIRRYFKIFYLEMGPKKLRFEPWSFLREGGITAH